MCNPSVENELLKFIDLGNRTENPTQDALQARFEIFVTSPRRLVKTQALLCESALLNFFTKGATLQSFWWGAN